MSSKGESGSVSEPESFDILGRELSSSAALQKYRVFEQVAAPLAAVLVVAVGATLAVVW